MNCADTKKHLIDYVLEELDPELQIQVNEHLAVCEKCRAGAAETERTVDEFKESARFKPASDVYRDIAERIVKPKPSRTRLLGIPKSLVFALGAFLLGIIMTRSIDTVIRNRAQPSRIEVRQEVPRIAPFSDTVEFYSVPAKNLARI
ncbi:MAG: zf-HC2 domain-containing protein [candidate division WOR-3 bacterium]|jgi:anti-sigma factor RsiW